MQNQNRTKQRVGNLPLNQGSGGKQIVIQPFPTSPPQVFLFIIWIHSLIQGFIDIYYMIGIIRAHEEAAVT